MGDIVVCPIEDKLCQGGGVMCYFTVEEAKKQIDFYNENHVYQIKSSNFGHACREIIRLNEVIANMDIAWQLEHDERIRLDERLKMATMEINPHLIAVTICEKCGSQLVEIRPGKWQCPECE